MIDPQKFHTEVSQIVLHAWIATYLQAPTIGADRRPATIANQLHQQSAKLQESAAQLAAALERMRVANAKLAARMAEHRAFFAKYQTPG
jgi:hypothetical protein